MNVAAGGESVLKVSKGKVEAFKIIVMSGALLIGYLVMSLVMAAMNVNLFGCFNIVPAGYVGVHDVFGNVDDRVQYPGLHLKSPVAGVTTFSVQRLPIDFLGNNALQVLTGEGVNVGIDATVWYHVDGNKAVSIYKHLGNNPAETQLVGTLRGIVRSAASNYTAEDIYTGTERLQLESDVITALNARFNQMGIFIDDFQIRKTNLPLTITDAINAKIATQNQIIQQQNRLQIEKIKAEQMVVEARGIADSNAIIEGSLTDRYLQWYAIKTLGANSNVTIIGSNSFGLARVI